MRFCKSCGLDKPYNPSAKKNSKASGFHGRVCWDCYLEANLIASLKTKRRKVTDPNTGEVVTVGTLSSRRKVIDPNTGEVITAGALSNRRKVVDPNTGEVITAGALAQRRRIASGQKAEYTRNRMATNPLFKLRYNIASLIRSSMKGKGFTKSSKTAQLLGCSYQEFKAHLESQFTEGMTWENAGEWHLDHILPVSCASNEEELIALQHYSNFQPMWGADNLSKSGSRPDDWREELDRLLELVPATLTGGNISSSNARA